jgi:dTDP-4-amino-4,6-dideoxygalactose transaminase
VEHLRNAGIAAGIHYSIALPNLKACHYLGYHPEDFPKATTFSKELISLPIFPELRMDEVEYVAAQIKAFFYVHELSLVYKVGKVS